MIHKSPKVYKYMKIKFLITSLLAFILIKVNAQEALNVMPYPQKVEMIEGELMLNKLTTIKYEGAQSAMVSGAIVRFMTKYKNASLRPIQIVGSNEHSDITIQLNSLPHLGIPNLEAYQIQIDSTIQIQAASEIGILYALETLNQLMVSNNEGVHFKKLTIQDWPTYAWRGMMVDLARHFIPMEMMKRNVDAMAAVKLNTLHIHISDDEGFRIESKKYPKLQEQGSNGKYYTQNEMINFVKYCKERGIEVYAEFDLPGHSQSWFAGYPELAAEKKIYTPGPRFKIDGDKPVNLTSLMQMMNTTSTPSLDVSAEATYTFLDNLTKEMKPIFSKAYMHMGLDENNGVAWLKNPKIVSFMQTKGIKTPHELQNYFSEKFSKIIEKNGLTPIAWEEAFHNGLNKNILVQVWKPGFMGPTMSIDTIAANGNSSIISRGFYLDVFMPAYYHFLNADFIKEKSDNKLLGGEAAIWSELVDESNFESRVWPRAAVIAERFWSSNKLLDVDNMYERLNIINHKLSWDGLQQISSVEKHVDQFTNSQLNEGGKELLSLITPIKGYKKIMGLMTKPTAIQPSSFRQLSDIIPIDAAGKWVFRKQVKQYLQNPNQENRTKIEQSLGTWKQLSVSVAKSGCLSSIQIHADNLTSISSQILTYMSTKDEILKSNIIKQISIARTPVNETELAILDELDALVSGKLKDLDMSLSVF